MPCWPNMHNSILPSPPRTVYVMQFTWQQTEPGDTIAYRTDHRIEPRAVSTHSCCAPLIWLCTT